MLSEKSLCVLHILRKLVPLHSTNIVAGTIIEYSFVKTSLVSDKIPGLAKHPKISLFDIINLCSDGKGIMKINIDRDMLLTELYDLRSVLAEAALISDEARDGKEKLDKIINLITNCPQAEGNSSYPKPKLRRG